MKRLFVIAVICFHAICHGQNTAPHNKDSIALVKATHDWNTAHARKDTAFFQLQYNDTVLYYGRKTDKRHCVSGKQLLFKTSPDYSQQLKGNITIEKLPAGQYKTSFLKSVTVNLKTREYPSYLVFAKSGNTWLIITEGDLITDKNLARMALQKKAPANAVAGDFNGDGRPEYCWLIKPTIASTGEECTGPCNATIRFSDKSIPDIVITSCIGGKPDNLGDLNENNSDELGLLPDWFSSCWRGYYVYTLINGKWEKAVPDISTHCDQWEKGIFPIKKDPSKKGYAIVRSSNWADTTINIITKSVKVRSM